MAHNGRVTAEYGRVTAKFFKIVFFTILAYSDATEGNKRLQNTLKWISVSRQWWITVGGLQLAMSGLQLVSRKFKLWPL